MRIVWIFALLVFWIVLAYRSFARGDMTMASIFLVAGIGLTVVRLNRHS